MLERTDEDHRSLLCRDGLGEVVFIVEGSRDADTENADDLVNGARAARSGEDHHRVGVATDGVEDDRAAVLTQPVVCQPVPLDSVWVLAWRGSTSSRRKSSRKLKARSDAV